MKRIRRNISPVLMAGLGIWFLVRRNASMEILAIIVMVLSALGIVLHVTDKESTKAGAYRPERPVHRRRRLAADQPRHL